MQLPLERIVLNLICQEMKIAYFLIFTLLFLNIIQVHPFQ